MPRILNPSEFWIHSDNQGFYSHSQSASAALVDMAMEKMSSMNATNTAANDFIPQILSSIRKHATLNSSMFDGSDNTVSGFTAQDFTYFTIWICSIFFVAICVGISIFVALFCIRGNMRKHGRLSDTETPFFEDRVFVKKRNGQQKKEQGYSEYQKMEESGVVKTGDVPY